MVPGFSTILIQAARIVKKRVHVIIMLLLLSFPAPTKPKPFAPPLSGPAILLFYNPVDTEALAQKIPMLAAPVPGICYIY